MNTRTVQLSFAGGEISPELYGRPDATQYRTGAAQLKNWVVKPQGPARTRPGFRHVATSAATNAPRMVPFIYSTGQSLALEISRNASGKSVVRFFTQGAPLLWAVPFNLGSATVAVDTAADTLTGLERHEYAKDTQVKVLAADGATLPTGISGGTTYYAHGSSTTFTARRFQLHTSSGGSSLLNISGAGSGYIRAFKSADLPAAWAASTAYAVGDLIYWQGGGGVNQGVFWCVEAHTSSGTDPLDAGAAKWHRQPDDGALECVLPVSYAQADLDKLVWRQNGDVLTLANNAGTYALVEIQRAGATSWKTVLVSLGSSLTAPTISSVVSDRGSSVFIKEVGTWSSVESRCYTGTAPGVAVGDVIYVETIDQTGTASSNHHELVHPLTGARTDWVAGSYIVNRIQGNSIGLRDLTGRRLEKASSGSTGVLDITANFYYSSSTVDTTQKYKVSALDDDGRESLASAEGTGTNVLEVNGATNTVNWSAITGASRYRVYKKENGLFGYIGESDTTSFEDDNIAPDLGRTPPITDTSITGSNYPAAVGGHEQRLFLASTSSNPQTVWGSKTGSELDFTFTLPVQDDNRLKFVLDSNQAQTVRHILGMRDLILLTLSGEFRVRATDDGALAPSTVFARQEGYDGANNAQPAAISSHVVYCAARGGHVRKLAYEARRAAFESLSVSLRAPHLFDDFEVTDFGAGKAPFPCVWACSSSGKLLGLTFVPEEQVEGWHQHETTGTFESIAVVPEDDEDVVYASVKHTNSSGATVYTVERMQEFAVSDIKQAACLDAHTSTYSTAAAPYTAGVRVDATSLAVGAAVTLTGRNTADSSTETVFDSQDVGREVHLTSGTTTYRVQVTGFTSDTSVSGMLLDALPASLAGSTFASGSWRFASSRVYVPAWQAGTSCAVVADSVEATAATAVASAHDTDLAYVDLASPGLNVHVGLAYTCDLQTLPIAIQVEGLGTGREKNIDKAWLRLYEAAGLTVGPDADNLQPVTDAQDSATLATGEKRTLVTGKWTEDGQLLVRQAKPFPATVVSLAARVSFGD
jgi:hypothetical protein